MSPSLSRREKLLLGLLTSTLVFSASFSYGAVSQSKVDSIMKMITDGGAKFSDIPVSGQTKSERTSYYEKVDAGLGDAVEMLATVRNNIRSLMGLSPAYTAEDIVGSILGGVMNGVGGTSGGSSNGSGTGGASGTTSIGQQKYRDAKLCTNFPSGMRYFIVYREMNITTPSLTQDVMYNTQDILSGATIRSLPPTATEAQKKAFIAADPLNTFTFKGYGTIDDILRSNMKGTTPNSTYRSGDKAIFIRYIDDYEGELLQCTAPVKTEADSQKEGVFVKKMYQVPVEHRKNEDFGGPFFSFNSNDKYTFNSSQKCIKTLDALRRINPDTIGPNNPNGYQYSSFKNPWGDCFFNVADHTKYKSGAFGADDIPDTCKIGSHFVVVPLDGAAGYSLSECVPKEYAYGIPPKSPDCTDTNNPDSTAVFDATKLIGGHTVINYRSPDYLGINLTKSAGEDLPSPVVSLRYDLRSKSLVSPLGIEGSLYGRPDGYGHVAQGELGMFYWLMTISPCKGDFTSPEARLISGKLVNMPINGSSHTIYTATPDQFPDDFKLMTNVIRDRFMPIRMQNGGLWYINIQSRWGRGCTGWYPNSTNCGDEKSSESVHIRLPMHIRSYPIADPDRPGYPALVKRISHKDWLSFWTLPPGATIPLQPFTVHNEEAWLKGGNGSWQESHPNEKPVGVVTGPELKCEQLNGTGPYYKVNYYLQTLPEENLVKDTIRENIKGITGKTSFQRYLTKNVPNPYAALNPTVRYMDVKYAEWAQPAETPVKAYSDSVCTKAQ